MEQENKWKTRQNNENKNKNPLSQLRNVYPVKIFFSYTAVTKTLLELKTKQKMWRTFVHNRQKHRKS